MKDALPSLRPQDVWQSFYNITQVPRPSGYMDEIRAFLVSFGNGLNLDTTADQVGNVLIRKPASEGMEKRAGVVLQAHMDMVDQKTPDKDFDFLTDPIEAHVAGDWVHADNTTLGADDGIGVAIIMALLQRKDLVAPAIEALFTVDEERGMVGVNGLGNDELQGSHYINLDWETEGELCFGSAGGLVLQCSLAYQPAPLPPGMPFYTVSIARLTGGHSGLDINKGRGHATKLLVRLLGPTGGQFGLRLAGLEGGTVPSAIPREARALVALPPDEARAFRSYLKEFEATVRKELADTEPGLAVDCVAAAAPPQVMTPADQERVLDVLLGNPQGVLRMSDSVPGLVQTSNNMGIVTAQNGLVQVMNAARSGVDSELTDAGAWVCGTWDQAGGQCTVLGRGPVWNANPDSLLLHLFEQTYKHLWGVDARRVVIHAGLECGVVAGKYPQMDLISIGPTLADVHSPAERVQISTVAKVFDLLVAVLGQIPAP